MTIPTVLIPSYNRPDMLKTCLDSLYKTNPSLFNVLIVDDCSPQRVEVMNVVTPFFDKYQNITAIETRTNGGFTKCVNTGIRYLREQLHVPSHILLLNNDTVLTPDWVKMQQLFHDPKPVGVVSCFKGVWCQDSIYPTPLGEDKPYAITGHPCDVRTKMVQELGCTSWYEEHVGFWGVMIRFDLFEKYGLFDERFEIICQDLDWSWRIRKYGWRTKVVNFDWIMHTGRTHIDLKPRDYIDKNVENDNRLIREIWPEKWN